MEIASLITLLYTTTCIGTVFAVPAFLTYKAIQHDGPDAFRVREWSMYWNVLAAFFCIQYLVDFALSWLPFYYILKLGFLAALWLPSTRLALTIYKRALGPWLSSHEAEIDAKFRDMQAEADERADRQKAIVKATLQRLSDRASVMLQRLPDHHRTRLDRLIHEVRARAAAVQERQEVRARAAAPQHFGARAAAGAGGQQHQAPRAAAQPLAQPGLRHRNLNVEVPNNNRRVDAAGGQALGMPEAVTSPGQPKTPDATFPVGLDLHAD